MKRSLKRLAALVLGLIFLGSGTGLLMSVQKGRKEEQSFRDLAQKVSASEPAAPEKGDSPGQEILPQYQALYQENHDLAGWVRVDGTNIDYPVMFTPGDVEYYLHRDFYGADADAGTPFVGYGCSLKPRSDNLVLYGHNMKNGTMFHDLLNYAQEDFCREHPVIVFDTLEQAGEYQVAAAFYTQIYPEEAEGVFRYYEFTDLSDPRRFALFWEQVASLALYDTGLKVEYGDQLLTLSTCSYHAEEGRFVVIAKRME